jgi:hypothetical protein
MFEKDRFMEHLPPILGLAVPLLALCIPIVYLLTRSWLQKYKTQQIHATIRHLAQNSQPIPPELLLAQEPSKLPIPALTPGQKRDQIAALLRKSLLSISAGIGLSLVVYLVNLDHGQFTGFHGWAWGLLPFMLGLGWGLLWWIESRQLSRDTGSAAKG